MCPKSFSLKQNLKDHLKAHLNVTHIDTMSIDDKTFYCVECDLSYTTQAKLNHHLKRGTRHLQPEQFKFVILICDLNKNLYKISLNNLFIADLFVNFVINVM